VEPEVVAVSMIDLTVTGWCDQIYDLQRAVEDYGPVDEISAPEMMTLVAAIASLHGLVAEKINAYVETKGGWR